MEKGKGKREKGQPGAWVRRAVVCSFLVGQLFAFAPGVAAQGCAMCYDSAKQQSAEAASALNTGILVLLLPSLLLFGGVVVTAFRRREETETDS